jgi:Ni/Fe-hydrogenase b-type cytochrome subunit
MSRINAEAAAGGAKSAEGYDREIGEYRWVYLWQWPIRAMHWAAAASILVLIVTGFYIGKPYFTSGPQAASPYLMGWFRLAHFVAAGVLVATGIVRMYWLFAGNSYENWKALVPVRARDWKNLVRMIQKYLMIHPERAPHYVGHHPLQQWSYTLVYALTLFMVVSGFALYGLYNPGGLFYRGFGWFGAALGGAQATRFWHHVLTWAYLVFVPMHVYLSLRADVTEKEGTMSSIFSGGKFVRADLDYEDGELP